MIPNIASSRVQAVQAAATPVTRGHAVASAPRGAVATSTREAALDTLTALFQTLPLPRSGKLISAERAQNAAFLLLGGLQRRELKLVCVTHTLCLLLECGAARILPELDRVCRGETGHGILKVHLGTILTTLLQGEQPEWLGALKAMPDLEALVLTPSAGDIHMRLLPLVSSTQLLMQDANTQVNVHAHTKQSVTGLWSSRPTVKSVVHHYEVITEERQISRSLGGHVDGAFPPLLTDAMPRVTAARTRRTSQQPLATPDSASSILRFMQGGDRAPAVLHLQPVRARAAQHDQLTVTLVDAAKPDAACWVRVSRCGTIRIAFLEAPDNCPAVQGTFQVGAQVGDFAAELAERLQMPGVSLRKLLDALASRPFDAHEFAGWLTQRFTLLRESRSPHSQPEPA